MTVRSLRERWSTAGGKGLAAAVAHWLFQGGDAPDGLPVHDGRADLRGLPLPSPSVMASFVAASTVYDVGSTPLEVRRGGWASLDLSHAHLPSLRIFDTAISDCRFDGAECGDWRLWASHVADTSFTGARMRDSAIGTGLHDGRPNAWRSVSFDRADLRGVLADGCLLSSCSFRGTKLTGARFHRSALTDCVFSGLVRDVVFDGRELPGEAPPRPLRRVDFSDAQFEDVEFMGVHAEDVELPGQPGVRLLSSYPLVARRALEMVSAMSSVEARMLAAELKNSLKLPGADDSVALFNRRDYAASGSESLADLAETVFTRAEEYVRGSRA